MDIARIVYASQPFGYDEAMLAGILTDARRCNRRDGITGALICRRDIYLQMLEGPAAAVRHAFDRIRRDDRHVGVECLISEVTLIRLFPDWDMLHDPAKSWLWTREEITEGVLETVSHHQILNVFRKLSSQTASLAR